MQRRTRGANRRTQKKRKWSDNQLVKINGERFRAALQHSGLNLGELARKLGEKRQTLDSIVRGQTDRCRESRRAAIAKALAVPAEWLGGGAEGGMDWLFGQLADRPQSQLALNRLGRLCERALQRDGSPVPNATGLILTTTLLQYWRSVLFDELPLELLECEDLAGPERDHVQSALVNAFEAILQPWLTGRAQLNYVAVRRLTNTVEQSLGESPS